MGTGINSKVAQFVWIFNGIGSKFPSGVFSEKDKAFSWISKHRLTGVLTSYPIDVGVYDFSIHARSFMPERDDQKSPEFIGKFSSASLEHYHFENGGVC
jgi:hypothetical protein